ncbi:hypothetical protein [uncultured Microscilla sp.]|uniref:hypothetical protein n=1 Tax=uncultured Microscilla sp. TaxID=432653 RepID=UPI00261D1282|nr:hypothetical protein [uncultured Microscilla sp.]
MAFSSKELNYLQDTDFLLTKHQITTKVHQLLENTQTQLKAVVADLGFDFPEAVDITQGKISKGEQYQQLPYLVLDYPKLFSRADVFAFRTMCWWGNEFSCTLMLAEKSWHLHRAAIAHHLPKLTPAHNWYIGVNTTPWEHHFGEDNCLPLANFNPEQLQQHLQKMPFLKLSRKLPLDQWQQLPDFANECFKELIGLMTTIPNL